MMGWIFLLPGLTLQGDESSSVQVGWQVQHSRTLTILGSSEGNGTTTASTFVIPQPSAADLERGYIEQERAITLLARSNTPWMISVRTDDPHMGRSFDGTYLKPVSDLLVRAAGRPYLAISHEDQLLTSGPAGEHLIGVDYRVLFNRHSHREGNYSITIIYTISTP
jgi:hypothetical protein